MLSKLFVGYMGCLAAYELLFEDLPRMPSQEPFTAQDIFAMFLLCLIILAGDLLIAATVGKDTKKL